MVAQIVRTGPRPYWPKQKAAFPQISSKAKVHAALNAEIVAPPLNQAIRLALFARNPEMQKQMLEIRVTTPKRPSIRGMVKKRSAADTRKIVVGRERAAPAIPRTPVTSKMLGIAIDSMTKLLVQRIR